MGRIRTIKPEFWLSEDLSSLPAETHLLAAALLNFADDEGYFNANPGLIKAACTPLREPSVSIQESLKQLSDKGYLRLGNCPDGKRYGHIVKFAEHQRVNRPTPSKIKLLDVTWEYSLNPHGALIEASPPERKGKEGKDSRRGDESPREFIWRAGVDLLTSAGEHDKSARSFLGRLCKLHGDDIVREAVGRAIAVAPAEPKAWLEAALKRANGTAFDDGAYV